MLDRLQTLFSKRTSGPVTAVSPEEAAVLLRDNPETVLLDVREPWELRVARISSAVHIPLALLPLRLTELDRRLPHMVLCHHGGRSYQACLLLAKHGFSTVMNVQGGIHLWALTVDSSLPRY